VLGGGTEHDEGGSEEEGRNLKQGGIRGTGDGR